MFVIPDGENGAGGVQKEGGGMNDSGRPPHLRWGPIGLVAAGGTVGAACREGLSLLIPSVSAVPLAIPAVNVIGAFLLGYLYEALANLDKERSTGTRLRLLLGTGFCGGFTTYSALARDTAVLFRDGLALAASVYALGTIVVGACATWAGILLSGAIGRRSLRAAQEKDKGPSR
ncbi:MAG: CrcB family protein, partial [Arthrobacter sp.]